MYYNNNPEFIPDTEYYERSYLAFFFFFLRSRKMKLCKIFVGPITIRFDLMYLNMVDRKLLSQMSNLFFFHFIIIYFTSFSFRIKKKNFENKNKIWQISRKTKRDFFFFFLQISSNDIWWITNNAIINAKLFNLFISPLLGRVEG